MSNAMRLLPFLILNQMREEALVRRPINAMHLLNSLDQDLDVEFDLKILNGYGIRVLHFVDKLIQKPHWNP
jgi:hypothetical protein